jgi:Fic family protein
MGKRLDDRIHNISGKDLAAILTKIALIDEFKGWWKGAGALNPQTLGRLKRSIVITSAGASTRIEGSRLSDKDVEKLLKGLSVSKLKDRDSQEVAGYAEVLELVFDSYGDISFTEGVVLQFHSMLLKYSEKDMILRGKYKRSPNKVVAVGKAGSGAVLFDPTEPHLVSSEMTELIEWTREHLKDRKFHPLLVIANFILEFLSIHPFHDGNGRLSRILTNLLLAKTGYAYMPYASIEKIIEDHKVEYYLSLREAQKRIKSPKAPIAKWMNFFLDVMGRQIEVLKAFIEERPIETFLSANQQKVLGLFEKNEEISTKLVSTKLKIPAVSAKQILGRLLDLKMIVRIGSGRSTRYRRIIKP